MNRRQFIRSTAVIALTPCITGFGAKSHQSIVGTTMGTYFKIYFEDPKNIAQVDYLESDVRSLLDEVEGRMSLYRKDSELCCFNLVKTLEWQPIGRDTARIIKTALETGERSHGAFSCTAGAISKHWGFGAVPVSDQNLLARVSSGTPPIARGVELSDDSLQLRKKHIDAEVDLNAIAKGDAVDQIATLLAQHRLTNYLVEIGGEFFGSSEPKRKDNWVIGISHPQGGIVEAVNINGKGIATSGDYIRERYVEGRRLTHLIDPNSGEAVDSNLASVSVIADTTIKADAWATALQVMGLYKGMLFAKENDIAAFFLNREAGNYVGHATERFNYHRVVHKREAQWSR